MDLHLTIPSIFESEADHTPTPPTMYQEGGSGDFDRSLIEDLKDMATVSAAQTQSSPHEPPAPDVNVQTKVLPMSARTSRSNSKASQSGTKEKIPIFRDEPNRDASINRPPATYTILKRPIPANTTGNKHGRSKSESTVSKQTIALNPVVAKPSVLSAKSSAPAANDENATPPVTTMVRRLQDISAKRQTLLSQLGDLDREQQNLLSQMAQMLPHGPPAERLPLPQKAVSKPPLPRESKPPFPAQTQIVRKPSRPPTRHPSATKINVYTDDDDVTRQDEQMMILHSSISTRVPLKDGPGSASDDDETEAFPLARAERSGHATPVRRGVSRERLGKTPYTVARKKWQF